MCSLATATIRKSGLARRLAYLVMLRVGNSYSRILLGLIILSFLLTFLVPSGTACVVIMAAIALGLLDAYGFGPGSNIGRGMFITLTLMLLAIGLWMTDFLHHIPPSMIGLGVGLFATLPRLGILDAEDVKGINYLSIIFVAAAISLGEVLIQTKALDLITNAMFAWMAPLVTNILGLSFVPYWTAFTYHLLLGTDVSMLSTSIPPLMSFAAANHINPLSIGMIWTFAAGGKIFVYQSAVMIVGYSYGYFEARDMFRVGICLTVIESILLLVLVPLYWPLLGIG